MTDSRHALLSLHLMDRLGPLRIGNLLSAFDGDPQAVLHSSAAGLEAVENIGPGLARAIVSQQAQARRRADAELAWLERRSGQLVTLLDADYPANLRSLPDPPICLFLRGQLSPAPGIAIVGTRACTAYGQRVAEQFSAALARAGLCIVSGLARGIDTIAHEAALTAGGATTAVIGSGLGCLYPPDNESLAERIVAAGHALLSEFPHAVGPQPGNFPRRNRIVAALAEACLVIESGAKGGSLITARLAAELGRSVFCIPGPIDRPASAGCHALIRDGAQLVTRVEDIVSDLAWDHGASPTEDGPASDATTARPGQSLPASLAQSDPSLLQLWKLLEGEELTLDELIARSQQPASQVSTGLLQLELLGLLRSSPGQRYSR